MNGYPLRSLNVIIIITLIIYTINQAQYIETADYNLILRKDKPNLLILLIYTKLLFILLNTILYIRKNILNI